MSSLLPNRSELCEPKAWEFMVVFLIKDVGRLETSVDDQLVHLLMAVFDHPPSSYVAYLHPDMQLSGIGAELLSTMTSVQLIISCTCIINDTPVGFDPLRSILLSSPSLDGTRGRTSRS